MPGKNKNKNKTPQIRSLITGKLLSAELIRERAGRAGIPASELPGAARGASDLPRTARGVPASEPPGTGGAGANERTLFVRHISPEDVYKIVLTSETGEQMFPTIFAEQILSKKMRKRQDLRVAVAGQEGRRLALSQKRVSTAEELRDFVNELLEKSDMRVCGLFNNNRAPVRQGQPVMKVRSISIGLIGRVGAEGEHEKSGATLTFKAEQLAEQEDVKRRIAEAAAKKTQLVRGYAGPSSWGGEFGESIPTDPVGGWYGQDGIWRPPGDGGGYGKDGVWRPPGEDSWKATASGVLRGPGPHPSNSPQMGGRKKAGKMKIGAIGDRVITQVMKGFDAAPATTTQLVLYDEFANNARNPDPFGGWYGQDGVWHAPDSTSPADSWNSLTCGKKSWYGEDDGAWRPPDCALASGSLQAPSSQAVSADAAWRLRGATPDVYSSGGYDDRAEWWPSEAEPAYSFLTAEREGTSSSSSVRQSSVVQSLRASDGESGVEWHGAWYREAVAPAAQLGPSSVVGGPVTGTESGVGIHPTGDEVPRKGKGKRFVSQNTT